MSPPVAPLYRGSFTALVTPFRNGALDEDGFRALVEWQVTSGTHGLVPCGTTGESSTLTLEEHERVVSWCVEQSSGRVPVIAGAGSNRTDIAVELARSAEARGADAVLVVAPYYNRPSQEGLYRHFEAVHQACRLPIYVYNIPARSAVEVSLETMVRLSRLPRIVGVKDATANLSRPSLERAACGAGFNLLSAEDATALAYLAQGGHGCISVTSNVAPRQCADLQEAWRRGDPAEALALHDRLIPLHTAMFAEPNPAGPKYALSRLLGLSDEVRLPLVPLSEGVRRTVDVIIDAMA